ncbi:MAG: polyprenol monophosphomannose synthase [Longimicrobiales bacterium]|nr:polyprenol monophosphomannose synthase [Longimicrobiales bacterium]
MNVARVLVIIPTYNERENLPRIVPEVLAVDPRVSILVVDDGSPDGTGDVADALATEHEGRVHVLHRTEKEGLGRAYVAAFRWGLERDYDALCEMDADHSHQPSDLSTLLTALEEHDLVIGSRYVGGRVNVVNWPLSRLLISISGSLYARVITRLPVRDATGGFNLFRADVLRRIDLDRIESNGYTFQIELKLRAWRKGARLTEVPIVFVERDSGESKMSGAIVREAVWKVWKLRFLDLLGRL